MKHLLSVLLTAILVACSAGKFQPRGDEVFLPGIPVYEQTGSNCGPATLASLLNYYGDAVNPDSIEAATHRDAIEGTLTLDILAFAKSRGFDSRIYRSSKDDLLHHIDISIPLICMIETDDPNPFGPIARAITGEKPDKHYVLVIGYSSQTSTIIAHTGRAYPQRIKMPDFLAAWRKTDFVAIEIVK